MHMEFHCGAIRKGKITFFLLLWFLSFIPVSEAGLREQVLETVLPNGLKVLLLENHKAPVITFQVWYRVGSRLMDEIRVRRGLAYSVASFFDPGKFPGSFQVVLETKNVSAREAISLVLQQMKRIQREMVSEQELITAKHYLTGSFPLRLDTQAKMAGFITQVEYHGLGLDYPEKYPSLIRSVTREEVLRVAKAYLHPDNYVLVVVANLKEAGMKGSGN